MILRTLLAACAAFVLSQTGSAVADQPVRPDEAPAPREALRIEKAVLCKEVSGFGRFTPSPDNQPYRPNDVVQLYLEVRNIRCQPIGDEFVTHAQAAAEIRDESGWLVDQINPDDYRLRVPVVKFDKRLVSRSPLQDFHVLYVFPAPSAPGVYTVAVELRDASGSRTVKSQPAVIRVTGR